MAVTIKNPRVEALVREIVEITGETKTLAIERALEDRKAKLRVQLRPRSERLGRFLLEEVWPRIPKSELGRRLTKEEEEAILGYGEHGV